MKKSLLTPLAILFSTITFAQTNWDMNLNSIIPPFTSNFGTASNHPINFYTNNAYKMSLSTSGILSINSLLGVGNRFLQTDANGNIIPWTGTAQYTNSILFGDGTWRPNLITTTLNNISIPLGAKFGIGIQNPNSALDVVGDISSTGTIQVNSGLKFSNSDGIYYDQGNQIFQFFRGNNIPLPMLDPCITLPPINTSNFIHVNGGFAASQNNGNDVFRMFVEPVNGNGYLEMNGNNTNALSLNTMCGKNTNINTGINGGIVQIGSSANLSKVFIGDYINMNRHVEIGDPNNGILSNPNNVALEIHTHIGKGLLFRTTNDNMSLINIENNSNNIYKSTFNVFGDGSTEIKTDNPTAFKIGWAQGLNPNFLVYNDGNILINSYAQDAITIKDPQWNLIHFNVSANGYTEIKSGQTKALSIYNGSNETVSINKDGYSEIKVFSPTGMPNNRVISIKDMSANRDLFVVKSDGKVFAREIEISLATTFPDYVFSKEYTLSTLSSIELFIKTYKHLPGFESSTHYQKNGINVSELLLKQQEKIEELYLYVIQLEKNIQSLTKN